MTENKNKTRHLIRQGRGIVIQQLGYRTEFYHPNLIRTYIPTLPFESFDIYGEKVLPWHLLKLFDSCEISSYWPVYENCQDANRNVYFMQSFEMSIDRSFYNVDNPKHPLIIDNKTLYVRRTSRCRRTNLYHTNFTKPYATMIGIDVNMDPETLQPKPFPAWWRDRFNFPQDGDRIEHKLEAKPDELCVSKHRIYFSDTDDNNHANYTTYVRFCYDSFCENMLNYKYGSIYLFKAGLKSIKVTYKKECFLGDVVTVHSWEGVEARDTFYFEVLLNNELCVLVTFCFHSPLKYHSNL